jgi:prepilin-type N-terminal cleavage/methylation domain-containing protein
MKDASAMNDSEKDDMQTESRKAKRTERASAGFSLVELMVALAVTLVIMVVASRMLAMSMAVRSRENQRSEAIADVERALQVMSREISNAGLGLKSDKNGLMDDDSDDLSIRIRSNLDAFTETTPDTTDADEDVVYAIITNNTGGDNQRLITRQDVNAGTISPLANRVDGLLFEYLKADGTTAATPSVADKVRITVTVVLPAVGSRGQAGYQPASRMQLVSEASLRNRLLSK